MVCCTGASRKPLVSNECGAISRGQLQLWHLAKALAAALNVSRPSASSSEICYWLIRDGAANGLAPILRQSYPSQNQAVFVAPYAHITNAHDMASVLTEAKIRPSWTGNDDLPSMGFYARLKFHVSNMRLPSNDREGRLALEESLLAARKFGGYNSSSPVCAFGWGVLPSKLSPKGGRGRDADRSSNIPFCRYYEWSLHHLLVCITVNPSLTGCLCNSAVQARFLR